MTGLWKFYNVKRNYRHNDMYYGIVLWMRKKICCRELPNPSALCPYIVSEFNGFKFIKPNSFIAIKIKLKIWLHFLMFCNFRHHFQIFALVSWNCIKQTIQHKWGGYFWSFKLVWNPKNGPNLHIVLIFTIKFLSSNFLPPVILFLTLFYIWSSYKMWFN